MWARSVLVTPASATSAASTPGRARPASKPAGRSVHPGQFVIGAPEVADDQVTFRRSIQRLADDL